MFTVLAVVSLVSCFEEVFIPPEIDDKVLDFKLEDAQEAEIYSSRGVSFEVVNPIPKLRRSGVSYPLDRFEIRGESTLKFRKKSFSINMDTTFYIYVDGENRYRDIEEYKLISLVYDYTYIEGAIAHTIFRGLELWPTHSEYLEVRLNGNTQGLYLLIEDPVEFFLYERDASMVLRRGYQNRIKAYHLNDTRPTQPEEVYFARFDSIYSYILKYDGQQCYDSLNSKLNLEEYFTKLSVDLLLANGDYTDEVYFYTREVDGKEIFCVYPWDYDDLFQSLPHEIGRDWAVGKLFGIRQYDSMEDIYNDVGERLLFSIEDDLDYKIARDSLLYQAYLGVLEKVISQIDDEFIENTFWGVKDTLQPFYDEKIIIAHSKYDENATNQELFEQNLVAKQQFILDRRTWILQELENQKK